jgi:hypothetical protein
LLALVPLCICLLMLLLVGPQQREQVLALGLVCQLAFHATYAFIPVVKGYTWAAKLDLTSLPGIACAPACSAVTSTRRARRKCTPFAAATSDVL